MGLGYMGNVGYLQDRDDDEEGRQYQQMIELKPNNQFCFSSHRRVREQEQRLESAVGRRW